MLILEMYKIKHNVSEHYFKDLYSAVNGSYILHSRSDFKVSGKNAVF